MYTMNDFKNFLDQVVSTYPGYPIWITEFANATGSFDVNVDFMKNAIDLFQNYPIERYAWFTNQEINTYTGYELINHDTKLFTF